MAVGGTAYQVAQGLQTTAGGTGTGALVDITQIDSYSGPTGLNASLIQLYINLANASLQQARWLDTWPLAMSLFVAHFLTLYLQSEGNPTSNPAQIAQSGLARGILVSKSVGSVSGSYETIVRDLEGFAAWNLTTYGQQLATFAKIIGMGPQYIYGD